MDQMADFGKFQRLMARLCSTMDKFATDELVETWWKALRTVPYREVEQRMEDFMARAKENTRFPRPGQFRPDDMPIVDSKDEAKERRLNEENQRNWRAFIDRYPYTGMIRLKLALCSRILVTEQPHTPAYAEAQAEELALLRMLGEHGRFCADR
jgi:hypothetical protein